LVQKRTPGQRTNANRGKFIQSMKNLPSPDFDSQAEFVVEATIKELEKAACQAIDALADALAASSEGIRSEEKMRAHWRPYLSCDARLRRLRHRGNKVWRKLKQEAAL
jgi:hypothetical protein